MQNTNTVTSSNATMTTGDLRKLATARGINITERPMRELRAIAFPQGWIAIDPAKFHTEASYKCALAHEIGHCMTGTFYKINSPVADKERCERAANEYAARLLMPAEAVLSAFQDGQGQLSTLVTRFDVTADFAAMALDFYGMEAQ